MALKDENSINFKKLEEEFQNAVDADEKYQRENDAKFRAVGQKVASYEEFRDIVLASHLKPLEKGDRISDMGLHNQLWNINALNKHTGETEAPKVQLYKFKAPLNGHEFARDWRRLAKEKDEQYKYITRINGKQLAEIFKVEISCGLLGDILTTIENFHADDCGKIIDILDHLRTVNRFGLSVQFLSTKELDSCRSILDKIEHINKDHTASFKDLFKTIRTAYLK